MNSLLPDVCVRILHLTASQIFYCVFNLSLLKNTHTEQWKRDIPNAFHLITGSCHICY